MLLALLLATATTAKAGLIDAIGRDVGLTRSQNVDEAHGARMLQDANDGRPDNLYFAALLHLCACASVIRPALSVRPLSFEAYRWRPQIQQIYRSDASLAAAMASSQRCAFSLNY